MAIKKELGVLIRTIFEKGDYTEEGRKALDALPQHGDAAVDAMIAAMKKPPKSNLHPRDLMDTIGSAFHILARHSSDRLIDRLEEGAIDGFWVCSALRNAKGRRSLQALLNGLRDKNQYVRWVSASAVIHRRSRSAIPLLIELLKDRSWLVQCEIVFAMKKRMWLRRREALPLLLRLRANKLVRKNSVGTWRAAQEVIELIEAESGGCTAMKV
jgi:HEAT repeat protein